MTEAFNRGDDNIDEDASVANAPEYWPDTTFALDKAPPEQDLVRIYLNQIGKTALLTAEQEVELAKRIEAGVFANRILAYRRGEVEGDKYEQTAIHNAVAKALEGVPSGDESTLERDLAQLARDGEHAKAHLIEANLRLVVSLAKRYTGRGMAFMDLIQEGNIGLNRAVEKFDYMKGFKFSTYATWWIRQSISRGMADQSRTIRIPVHTVETLNKMGGFQREYYQETGGYPSNEAIAQQLDLTVEKVVELRMQGREAISLDQPVGEDSELGHHVIDGDVIDPTDIVEQQEIAKKVSEFFELAGLSERDARIVRNRYGLGSAGGRPMTLDEIGQIEGVSRERIRQVVTASLKKFKFLITSGAVEPGYFAEE